MMNLLRIATTFSKKYGTGIGSIAYTTEKFNTRNFSVLLPKKNLNEIADVAKLSQESREAIEKIWIEYHRNKINVLSGCLTASSYDTIMDKAAHCPLFVFPIPKGQGYVTMLSQTHKELQRCVFTTLEEYKSMKEQAPTHLCMNYFTDFKDSKDIIMMRGDITSNVITTQEAQYLVNMWQLFHLDEEKYAQMELFNHNPSKFDWDKLMQVVDTIPTFKSAQK